MTRMVDIGKQLVTRRGALGLSQRALGERLGVKQPQIARWEANSYASASLARVSAVAEILGLDTSATSSPLVAEAAAGYTTCSGTPDTGTRALDRLGVRPETLAAFCRLHGIAEMALFGSAVRTDFRPDSDVDLLVTWAEGHEPTGFGMLADLEEELRAIFRRSVDLVDRASVETGENYVRRSHILNGARSVYVAR
jgi:predicted nucleotidyltransferase